MGTLVNDGEDYGLRHGVAGQVVLYEWAALSAGTRVWAVWSGDAGCTTPDGSSLVTEIGEGSLAIRWVVPVNLTTISATWHLCIGSGASTAPPTLSVTPTNTTFTPFPGPTFPSPTYFAVTPLSTGLAKGAMVVLPDATAVFVAQHGLAWFAPEMHLYAASTAVGCSKGGRGAVVLQVIGTQAMVHSIDLADLVPLGLHAEPYEMCLAIVSSARTPTYWEYSHATWVVPAALSFAFGTATTLPIVVSELYLASPDAEVGYTLGAGWGGVSERGVGPLLSGVALSLRGDCTDAEAAAVRGSATATHMVLKGAARPSGLADASIVEVLLCVAVNTSGANAWVPAVLLRAVEVTEVHLFDMHSGGWRQRAKVDSVVTTTTAVLPFLATSNNAVLLVAADNEHFVRLATRGSTLSDEIRVSLMTSSGGNPCTTAGTPLARFGDGTWGVGVTPRHVAAEVNQFVCIAGGAGGPARPLLEVHALALVAGGVASGVALGDAVDTVASVPTSVVVASDVVGYSFALCPGGGGGGRLDTGQPRGWWATLQPGSTATLCVTAAGTTFTTAIALHAQKAYLSGTVLNTSQTLYLAASADASTTLPATLPYSGSLRVEASLCTAQGHDAVAFAAIGVSGGVLKVPGIAAAEGWLCVRANGTNLAWYGTAIVLQKYMAVVSVGTTHPILQVTPTIPRGVTVSAQTLLSAVPGVALFFAVGGCEGEVQRSALAVQDGVWRAELLLARYDVAPVLCIAFANRTFTVLSVQVVVSGMISLMRTPPPHTVSVMLGRAARLEMHYIVPLAAAGTTLFVSHSITCLLKEAIPCGLAASSTHLSLLMEGGALSDGTVLHLCAGAGSSFVSSGFRLMVRGDAVLRNTVHLLAVGTQRVKVFAAGSVHGASVLMGAFAGCPPTESEYSAARGNAAMVDSSGEVVVDSGRIGVDANGLVCIALAGFTKPLHYHVAAAQWTAVRFLTHGADLGTPLAVAGDTSPTTLSLQLLSGAIPVAFFLGKACTEVPASPSQVNTVAHTFVVENPLASSGLVFCVLLAGQSDNGQDVRYLSTGVTLEAVTAVLRHVSRPAEGGYVQRVGLLQAGVLVAVDLYTGNTERVHQDANVVFSVAYTEGGCGGVSWGVVRFVLGDDLVVDGQAVWVTEAKPVRDTPSTPCFRVSTRGQHTVVSVNQSVTTFPILSIADTTAARPLLPLLISHNTTLQVTLSNPGSYELGLRRTEKSCAAFTPAALTEGGRVVVAFEGSTGVGERYYLCARCVSPACGVLPFSDLEVRVAAVRVGLGAVQTDTGLSRLGVYQNVPASVPALAEGADVVVNGARPVLLFSMQRDVTPTCGSALTTTLSNPIQTTSCGVLTVSAEKTSSVGTYVLCAALRLTARNLLPLHFVDVGLRVVVTLPNRLDFITQPGGLLGSGLFGVQPRLRLVDPQNNTVAIQRASKLTVLAQWRGGEAPTTNMPTALWSASGAAATNATRDTFAAIDFSDMPTSSQVHLLGSFGLAYRLHVSIVSEEGGVALKEAVSDAVTRTTCLETWMYAPIGGDECVTCPVGAVCNGTTVLLAQEAYWRANDLAYTFYECPYPSACKNGGCAEGYYGPKCSLCVHTHGKTTKGCVKCGNSAEGYVVITIMGLGSLLWICAIVFSTLSAAQNIMNPVPLMIKITVNHLVVSSKLPDIVDKVPDSIIQVLRYQSDTQSGGWDAISASDCVLRLTSYQIFVGWMVVPFVIIVGAWMTPVVITVARWLRSRMGKEVEGAADIAGSADSQDDIFHFPILFLRIQFMKLRGGTSADALSISSLKLRCGRQEIDISDALIENPEGNSPAHHGCMNLLGRDGSDNLHTAPIPGEGDNLAEYAFPKEGGEEGEGSASQSSVSIHADLDWIDFNKKSLVVRLGAKQNVNGFTFSTSSGPVERDPLRWAVYWSQEGNKWDRVNCQFGDFQVPEERRAQLPWFVLQPSREGHFNFYVVCVVVLLHFSYPFLVEQAATMLACHRIDIGTTQSVTAVAHLRMGSDPVPEAEVQQDGGTYYVTRAARDLSLSCESEGHQRFYLSAQILLFVYGLGLPVSIAAVVMVVRKYKGKRNTFTLFHFLVSGLNKRKWYWELLIMLRKMAIIVIVNFVQLRQLRTYFAMWVVTGYLIITLIFQPFNMKMKGRPDHLETGSLMVISITLNLALLFSFVTDSTAILGPPCYQHSDEPSCTQTSGCFWLPAPNTTADDSDTDTFFNLFDTNRTAGCLDSSALGTWGVDSQVAFYALTSVLLLVNVAFVVLLFYKLIPRLAADYAVRLRRIARTNPWLIPSFLQERCARWLQQEEEEKARRRSTRIKSIKAANDPHNPLVAPSRARFKSDADYTDSSSSSSEADEAISAGGVDEWSSDSDDPQHDGPHEEVLRLRAELKRAEDAHDTHSHVLAKARKEAQQAAESRNKLRVENVALSELLKTRTDENATLRTDLACSEEGRALALAHNAEAEVRLETQRVLDASTEDPMLSAMRAALSTLKDSSPFASLLQNNEVSQNLLDIFLEYGCVDNGAPLLTTWGLWCVFTDAYLLNDHRFLGETLQRLGVGVLGVGVGGFLDVVEAVVRQRDPAVQDVLRNMAVFIPGLRRRVVATRGGAEAPCLLLVHDRDCIAHHICLHKAPHPVLRGLFETVSAGQTFLTLRSFQAALAVAGLPIDEEARTLYTRAVRTTGVLLFNQFVEAIFCVYQLESLEPWLGLSQLMDKLVDKMRAGMQNRENG